MLCFEFSLFVNYNCCNFDLLYLLGFFSEKALRCLGMITIIRNKNFPALLSFSQRRLKEAFYLFEMKIILSVSGMN